jgi:hypothetical protein
MRVYTNLGYLSFFYFLLTLRAKFIFSPFVILDETFLPNMNIDYIVSNPPYSLKAEVFERLFKLKIPFAMLVGVVGLFESKRRFEMFKDNKFEIMYFDKRISYFKSYEDQKPSLNPPFSSVYICKDILPNTMVFENITKK